MSTADAGDPQKPRRRTRKRGRAHDNKVTESTLSLLDQLLMRPRSMSLNGEKLQLQTIKVILLQLLQKEMTDVGVPRNVLHKYREFAGRMDAQSSRFDSPIAKPREQPRRSAPEARMDEYKVGYCKPPQNRRFKPGESGNAKGRPRRRSTLLADCVREVMEGPAEYRERGRREVSTWNEVSLRMLVERAANGDIGAADDILRVRRRAERQGASTKIIPVRKTLATGPSRPDT